ncbi:hypothetical protein BCT47_14165 [Vibrio splendidus]|uniref:hypothetical protein n=1 Tax=Vibrio splendidus TaxID=29497 RepID=UPI000C83FFCD|nr:hypothetical protein [Vibrio splendidus]MDP2588156.1 hypothetical protein [Vibrio splendidus]PMM76949.1 hypothetical protein BCT47_14165 [Vibrio splendidus]
MSVSREIKVSVGTATVIAVVTFILKNVLIASFITPTVIEQIKDSGHLNDDLKLGRYVTTTEDSFNSNHIINSDLLVSLKTQEYALNSQLSALEVELEKKVDKNKLRTQNLLTSESERLALVKANQEKIVAAIELLDAKIEQKIVIKVYRHSDDKYRGKIQLNSQNKIIANLVSNGQKYEVESGQNSYDYKVVLTPLKIEGKVSYDAVANLHIEDHNELFTNAKSKGIGSAYLHL